MTTTTLPIAPSNTEQFHAWDGNEGTSWATQADAFDRTIASHHDRFMRAAAIADPERVLDIGCGTGQTTRAAAHAAPNGIALGVDLSAAMLDVARQRAADEGLDNVRFDQADAQIHPFEPAGFDVAISRTGAMFFGDPVAAFTNIARAVRPNGRLVLLTWQSFQRNEWFHAFFTALDAGRNLPPPSPDAPTPFSLATPNRIRGVLGAAGFTRVDLEGFTERMWFGANADDAYRFVLDLLGWMLDGLDDPSRQRALDALRTTIAEHETSDGVTYESSAWIIRANRP